MTGALRACVVASAALGVLGSHGDAAACAVCGCGDATLTTMGGEAPFQGRMRAALEARYREDAIGTPGRDRIELTEGRIDASFSWAAHERLVLGATLPALLREVEYVNLARETTVGIGDAEVRAKFVTFKDRRFGARHVLYSTLGVKLPTGPEAEDDAGRSLPFELQPGTGSVDPLVGLSYATFQGDWSGYGSAHAYFATPGWNGNRASSSLRVSASAQRQLVPAFALRLGIDTRIDARATEDGRPEPDSGGFIGFLSPEALVSPGMDVTIVGSARIPVLNALEGEHDESVILSVAVAVDF
jgi:hypothetical protein